MIIRGSAKFMNSERRIEGTTSINGKRGMSSAMELLRTTAKRRTALLLVVKACIDSYQKRCSGRVLRQRELKSLQVTRKSTNCSGA
jgi:hypothetical protein